MLWRADDETHYNKTKYIDGLVHESCISIATALELRLS